MKKDNVISLEKPEENPDLLTGLLRSGARELITQAVHAELTSPSNITRGLQGYSLFKFFANDISVCLCS